ncbi:MAG: flippase-like domain-containing protein [Flavobacteriales bacterium]|nr:flippase-like domain-containing protein [Flavobacteriales bacterium]
MGSGHGDCDSGLSGLRVSAADKAHRGTPYEVTDTLGNVVLSGAIVNEAMDEKEYVSECLSPGHYNFVLPEPPEGEYSFSIQGVDLTDQLINDMKRASIPGIALSFLFGYLAIVSRGIRWQYLLEPLGYKPKTINAVNSVAFAYFANTFVPRSGELARCAALNQSDDIPVDKLFGTVISERVVDMVMLVIFMSVALISNLDAFQTLLDLSIGGGEEVNEEDSNLLVTIGLVVIGFVVALGFMFRRSIVSSKLYGKVKGFLSGVGDGLKSVLKMKRRGAFIFHTFFIWGMYFGMAYVIYMSIDATSHMTVTQSLFVMVAGGFGMILPAPGGIGSYHWTVKLGFIALGMSGALGFAVANVMWLTQTVMIVVTGGIGYLLLMWGNIRKERQANAAE